MIINAFGKIEYRNSSGELHRDNGPAIIWSNGTENYYLNGKRHRDGNKPADIQEIGTVIYYKNGKLHRDGDKPAIIYPDGVRYYYENGKMKLIKPLI